MNLHAPSRRPFPHAGRALPFAATPFDEMPFPVVAGRALVFAPFDAMRQQYAAVVTAGLMSRSLLASARMERALDALETLVLGPVARRR